MSKPREIYLDYAATTPLDPRVAHVMQEAMLAGYANPASQHQAGQAARKKLEEARQAIGQRVAGHVEILDAARVILTSGGTEANNLAILGLCGPSPGRVLISAIEHPSVMGPADQLVLRGYEVDTIRVDQQGRCDVSHFRELLERTHAPALVSVMFGNNETGVLQPVIEISEYCRQRHVLFHCDAVQAARYIVQSRFPFLSSFDATTLAAHKIGGPVGIGALILRSHSELSPQLFGGFQQAGFRPGTESLSLALGFAESLMHSVGELRDLRDRFEHTLRAHLDNITINGSAAERLPHISNVAFLGCDRQQLFLALDFAGVYCSTGSACASGSSEPSPVLRAMGLPEEVISSSLRFSFGSPTTRDEIDEAAERIVKCVKQLRSRKSARK
jgi:cysteine desulfurase